MGADRNTAPTETNHRQHHPATTKTWVDCIELLNPNRANQTLSAAAALIIALNVIVASNFAAQQPNHDPVIEPNNSIFRRHSI
jgi:hypothetical protein